jgi:2-dehydropantoate 2-reductase
MPETKDLLFPGAPYPLAAEAPTNGNGQMRIGVIGLGPVGLVLAAHFVESGAFVVGCDVDEKITDAVKKHGVKLTSAIERRAKLDQVAYTVQELAVYDLDLIVISTKTPALKKVGDLLADIDDGKMFVMVAQNGIDNERIIAMALDEERTIRMVVNFAGVIREPHVVHVSFFNPPNYVAALLAHGEPMAECIVSRLNATGLTTETPLDIQDYVWEKAILNAALSPVCAITKRTMKDVLDFPQAQELVEAIIDESVRVALAEGIILDKKFRRFSLRYLKNAGHHRPSMLADLDSGRPTEIEQLNGRIIEYGKKHHIPTPINLSIAEIVRMLERPIR